MSGTSDTTCELPVGPRGLCPRSLTHAASWSCLPLVSCLLVLLRVCFLESFSTGGAARLMPPWWTEVAMGYKRLCTAGGLGPVLGRMLSPV